MSVEVRHWLEGSAAAPRRPVDPRGIIKRGRTLRRRRVAVRSVAGMGLVVALSLAAPAVVQLLEPAPPAAEAQRRPWQSSAEVVAPLPGQPLGMVRGAGSIWVEGSNGQGGWIVTRIDEESGDVLSQTELDGLVLGTAFVEDGLWVLTRPLEAPGGTLSRIDAASDEHTIITQYDVRPRQLAVGDDPWVLLEGGQLLRLNERGDVVDRRSVQVSGIAVNDDEVWGFHQAGQVERIQPPPGRDSSFDLPVNVAQLEVTDELIVAVQQLEWGGTAVTGISSQRGRAETWETRFPQQWAAASIGPEDVWVVVLEEGKGELVRLDRSTGDVVGRFDTRHGPFQLLATRDTLWVVTAYDDTLSRLVPINE